MAKKKIKKKIPEEPITGGYNPSDIEFKDLRKEEEEFMKKRVKGSNPPSNKKINKSGGGSLKSVDVDKNPGLAKLPTPVRNKMGYAKAGGKVYRKKGGKVIKTNMSGNDLVRSCYD